MSDESKLTTADRRVIDRAVAEALRTLAHMARGNADQNVSAHDCDYLADIIEGKVRSVDTANALLQEDKP